MSVNREMTNYGGKREVYDVGINSRPGVQCTPKALVRNGRV